MGSFYMSTQMIVRIDPELKAKANNFAKAEGKNVSEVVRELLEAYVRNRDIGSYIDDLWNRTGKKLKSKGVRQKDVQQVIDTARAGK
jgi:predicted DNA-binding protein